MWGRGGGPRAIYPKLLGFTPLIAKSFEITLPRNSIAPLIVTRGADQVAVSTRYGVCRRRLWLGCVGVCGMLSLGEGSFSLGLHQPAAVVQDFCQRIMEMDPTWTAWMSECCRCCGFLGPQVRSDPAVIRNYGQLLLELAQITPDGLLCFFTSYSYMEVPLETTLP